MEKKTLLLVDDHMLFRKGIIYSAQGVSGEFRFLEASNGREAIETFNKSRIDLMILDIAIPDFEAYRILEHVKRSGLNTKIVILSLYSDPTLILNLLNNGVHGYLPKNSDPSILISVIREVLNNQIYYPKQYSNEIQALIQSGRVPTFRISTKELEIIKLLAEGLTSKEIAVKTAYTERTVHTKRLRLQKKFKAKSAAELVSYAYKVGILKI